MPDLCNNIRRACQEITSKELTNVSKYIKKRVDKCIILEGGLVKYFFVFKKG